MCGINGVFHYREGQPDRELLAAQAHAQRHRGPDHGGVWCEGPAALAHRRLSILDLSPGGHQPMLNEDHTVVATFNGEIYNWPELRPDLETRGHRFRGTSDTEMLVHLWEERGPELLASLRGMFAFAVYDTRQRRLMLARDRIGKKPLYWHDDGKRLTFASELKALMLDPSVPRDVDPASIAEFLAFQCVPAPRTIWRGVQKLEPGTFLVCDANGPKVERYWTLPVGRDTEMKADEAIERLRAVLLEAVRIRLVADVPLGAFLSGGVDSSAIVAIMAQVSSERVKTFSIGFDDETHSELPHARRVAEHLGTDHHELIVHPRAVEILPRLIWGLDEPFSDVSMIPTFYVAEMARHHVTVALSGDGGDETFAGYTTYPAALRYARYDLVPLSVRRLLEGPSRALPMHHRLGRKLHRIALDAGDRHLEAMSRFDPREAATVMTCGLRDAIGGHDPYRAPRALYARARAAVGDVPALLTLDAQTYLTDEVMVKVDRTSMLNSIEVRAPLLDDRVLEFVATMPFEFKLRHGVSKWALRECVRPLLPPGVLERGKQGFGVPLGSWFRRGLGEFAREVLHDRRARTRGWLEPAEVDRILDLASTSRDRYPWQAYTLLCLELWAQTWVDRPRSELASPTDAPYPLHAAVAGGG